MRSRLFPISLVVFTATLAFGLLSSTPCLAEPAAEKAKAGRLPDGRAYRVDASGYRLVDQIAELEVSNDDLRRQLRALENDLADKQSTINHLSSGKPLPSAALKETELVTSAPKAAAGKDTPDCNQLVSSLYLKVSRLEEELRGSKQSASAPAAAPAGEARCDYQSAANPLWEQVNRLQNALMEGPSKERYAKVLSQQEQLEIDLASTKQLLKEQAAKTAALETQLGDKDKLISSKDARLDQAQEQLLRAKPEAAVSAHADAAESRSSLANERASEAALAAAPQPEPVKTETRAEEVGPARAEFRDTLAQIQSGIMQRKALLDSLKGKDRGVSITAQPLVTDDGVSLDTLRGQVSKLDTHSNIAGIRSGLAKIRSILNEDTTLLQRLIKK